jgi:hypothetical protein
VSQDTVKDEGKTGRRGTKCIGNKNGEGVQETENGEEGEVVKKEKMEKKKVYMKQKMEGKGGVTEQRMEKKEV